MALSQQDLQAFWAAAPQPAKRKGRNIAQSLLPAAGATIAGLAAAPFTGGLSLLPTLGILGGAAALGGAAGEFGAQKSAGEKTDIGKIAKEAALSGAFGAGGEAFNAVRAAKAAGTGGKSLVDALTDAQAYQGLRTAGKTSRVANSLKTGVINPKTPASVSGAAEDQAIVNTVDKYVKGLTASRKYKNLSPAMDNLSGEIQKTLDPITKRTSAVDLTKRLTTDLADHPNFVPGDPAYERELSRVLNKVASFGGNGELSAADLFKAKQYLGTQLKGAFGKNGTDLTIPQQVRMAVWENLDNAITDIAPRVKELTTAQSYLIKSAPGLQQAAKKTLGLPLAGIKSKRLASGVQKAEYGLANALTVAKPITSSLGAQILPRVATGSYSPNSPITQNTTDSPSATTTIPASSSNIDQQYTNSSNVSSPFAPRNLESAIQKILENGGSLDDASKFVSLAATIQKLQAATGSSGGPLSAESAKVVSNAQVGIKALSDFNQLIDSDEGTFGRTNLPGVGVLDRLTGGRVSGALGTDSFNAARQQVIDVIARLRTGAAISKEEAARFETYVPQPGDSPETRALKTDYLMGQFQMVANRGVNSQPTDLASALLAAQGAY